MPAHSVQAELHCLQHAHCLGSRKTLGAHLGYDFYLSRGVGRACRDMQARRLPIRFGVYQGILPHRCMVAHPVSDTQECRDAGCLHPRGPSDRRCKEGVTHRQVFVLDRQIDLPRTIF